MAYIIKYIKKFPQDITVLEKICNEDTNKGYKIEIFSDDIPEMAIVINDVPIKICRNAKPQAVIRAKELYAEKCQFYFDRGGIFSIDPKEYACAKKVPSMDYDEALEMTVAGYHLLGEEVLAIAKRNSVRIEVLSLEDSVPTVIKEVLGQEGMLIKSVIKDNNIVIVTLTELPDKKGASYHIFKALSDENIFIDSIMLAAANHNQQDISFAIKADDKITVCDILNGKRNELFYKDVIITDNVAKISIIGLGIQAKFGVAASFLEILYKNDINVMMIFTTEIKISIVVEKSCADIAVHKIHKAFIE